MIMIAVTSHIVTGGKVDLLVDNGFEVEVVVIRVAITTVSRAPACTAILTSSDVGSLVGPEGYEHMIVITPM
jgi:hypothetical protein